MDISSMLEVEVQEVADRKENVTPPPKPKKTFACQTFTNEENDFYKLTYGSDIASVRFLRLHCTACDEHIGSAPSEAHNMHEHPVLRTLLCAKCREFYGDGTFEQGDDATDMFCRWCANGGNLYCCSYCSNTFCSKCIKRNFDPATIKRIEDEDSWKCFVCDPKDLYPLRSIARALISHIETVTRILEKNKKMSPREVEEKMHLDETKCCSRKRKRRRRRTLSGSEDDDEEDVNYEPSLDCGDALPAKKRRSRCNLVRSSCTNGFLDHEYNKRSSQTKSEVPEYDPADLMSQCEQTMIEGDHEILNPENANGSNILPEIDLDLDPTMTDAVPLFQQQPDLHTLVEQHQEELQMLQSPQQQEQIRNPQLKPQQHTLKQSQLKIPQQLPRLLPKFNVNNSMGINPVPLANLLKVALTTSDGKKIKMTHGATKLVAVPMTAIPKSIAAANKFSINKPTTHFLMPKNVAKSITGQNTMQLQKLTAITPQQLQAIQPLQKVTQQQKQPQSSQPSVIDLESDDESIIVENVVTSGSRSIPNSANVNVADNEAMETDNNAEDEPVILSQSESTSQSALRLPSRSKATDSQSSLTVDGLIPLKTQQRYQRFERMLKLQSHEIDGTVNELKTKILKLVQTTMTNRMQQFHNHQQDSDLQNAAFLCTKRFHRAVRKALVELSHINDRVVRDYVHWKKKADKTVTAGTSDTTGVDVQTQEAGEAPEKENIPSGEKTTTTTATTTTSTTTTTATTTASVADNVLLEMTCERDSASEDEEDDDTFDERIVEPSELPADFTSILDHLSIFKRKPTAVKAVGNDSILMHDKGCQAYDVPWRDYEKCIGYSLLTKSEYDPETKEEVLRPVVQPDENFGKYQEQYLFYLQHIEDCGIETDEQKGLPDPNHIPLKDLIDSSSPFIMDMLERLSPVTLSNGCTSPKTLIETELDTPFDAVGSNSPEIVLDAGSDHSRDELDNPSSIAIKNTIETSNSEVIKADESTQETKESGESVATSKAVEELVKMVTKLSEDLRQEQQQKQLADAEQSQEPMDLEKETEMAVNSILEITSRSSELDRNDMDVEITDVSTNENNSDDCTIID